MRTTELKNLPLPSVSSTESSKVTGGLNPQPLPPRYRSIINIGVLQFRGF